MIFHLRRRRRGRAFAAQSRKSTRAEALEFVDSVETSGAVEARTGRTLVDFVTAIFAGESRLARAPVVVD